MPSAQRECLLFPLSLRERGVRGRKRQGERLQPILPYAEVKTTLEATVRPSSGQGRTSKSTRNFSFNNRLAKLMRDLTVPTGIDKTLAISW
jgi:hypothetical protein